MTLYFVQCYTEDGRLWSWIQANKGWSDQTAAASILDQVPNAQHVRALIVTPTYVH
jgi:hypothetical protein